MRAIEQRLEEQEEVDDVVDLLTMLTGTGSILVCTRVDFVDTVSAGELELACVRVAEQLRGESAWTRRRSMFGAAARRGTPLTTALPTGSAKGAARCARYPTRSARCTATTVRS